LVVAAGTDGTLVAVGEAGGTLVAAEAGGTLVAFREEGRLVGETCWVGPLQAAMRKKTRSKLATVLLFINPLLVNAVVRNNLRSFVDAPLASIPRRNCTI